MTTQTWRKFLRLIFDNFPHDQAASLTKTYHFSQQQMSCPCFHRRRSWRSESPGPQRQSRVARARATLPRLSLSLDETTSSTRENLSSTQRDSFAASERVTVPTLSQELSGTTPSTRDDSSSKLSLSCLGLLALSPSNRKELPAEIYDMVRDIKLP